MGLARSLLAPIAKPALQASPAPSDTIAWREPFLFAATDAGVVITPETSLFYSVVFACVKVISDAHVIMPLLTYQRVGDDRRQVAGPTHQLVHDEPNPEQDGAQFWGDLAAHISVDGNAFAGKTFASGGKLAALWPIRPDWVRIERRGGVKIFLVRDEFGHWYEFTSREIIHVREWSLDGLRGISPIRQAAQQIGAGLALERFMNEFWANGAMPSAVLETKKTLDPGRSRMLANRFLKAYRGRRRGVVVLEDEVQFKPVTWNHVDAQFMEQKRDLVASLARCWRIPVSKVMAQLTGSSDTYRNLDQDNTMFFTDAVLPRAVRFERGFGRDRDLYPQGSGLFSEFQPDAVLRADALTRAQVERIRLGGAAMELPSEARRREHMPVDERLDEKALQTPAQHVPDPSANG